MGGERFYCLAEYENEQKSALETSGGNGLESSNVKDLSVPLEHLSADSLNLWLCKFICEAAKQIEERYPPKTMYLLVCGINRHLGNVQGEKAFNILEKSEGGKTTFFEAMFHLYQK